ncbi:protein NRT1/ PTR FAMILY 8.2-like [Miscanthus floridulus]|uniref:protein NRT1/ PTR FAMILY 8.2-like n=1 Tax=Miscanthus floridulus TaxID=154761 RepID=UPI0034576EE9
MAAMAGGGDESETTTTTTLDGTTDRSGKAAVRSKTGTWRACPFILGNECCERLAYYGMSSNLVNYMIDRLHQGNAAAANNVSNWSGTCYVMPLLGAFLADAYLGRYRTIAAFMALYIVGLTLLTMSAAVPGLRPPPDGGGAVTAGQSAAFFVALYLIAVGTGGIKPCVSSFGADQFDDADPRERQSKSSFFNWFYMSINVGALVASSVLVWVQMNVGWGWGFGIPAAAMAVAVASFLLGSKLYRHQKPGGSPLTRMLQVAVAAWRKGKQPVPADASLLHEASAVSAIQGSRKLEHTEQFRWLDRAAVVTADEEDKDGKNPNPWRLCTVTQVEELKSVIRLLPVWASGIVMSAVYSQMSTMFVLQGNTLDPRMGSGAGAFKIPSASLSIFDTLSVIAWAPAYDRLVVPAARRWTGHPRGFTQLQRMGIGLAVSVLSMLAAGALEVARLRVAASHGMLDDSTNYLPISIFWQVPQYFIIGAAEVFTFIGQIEFFYDQAPDAMRSMGTALSLTSSALGSYLSALLVSVVTAVTTRNGGLGWIPDNLNRGHLDYFFWLLSVLSVVNFVVYLWIAKWYRYKQATTSYELSSV